MEFAALASFGILFVAWLVAPDHPRATVAEAPIRTREVAEAVTA